MIRYRTRDLTSLLPGECPCGRTGRRMSRVTGRTDDMLIVRGVNVFPTQIEEMILKCNGLAPHYQIELRREGRLDEISVLVEARPSHVVAAARAQQAAELAHHIKAVIGVTARIEVRDPGAVEPRCFPSPEFAAHLYVERRVGVDLDAVATIKVTVRPGG